MERPDPETSVLRVSRRQDEGASPGQRFACGPERAAFGPHGALKERNPGGAVLSTSLSPLTCGNLPGFRSSRTASSKKSLVACSARLNTFSHVRFEDAECLFMPLN